MRVYNIFSVRHHVKQISLDISEVCVLESITLYYAKNPVLEFFNQSIFHLRLVCFSSPKILGSFSLAPPNEIYRNLVST